jgi:hypothetical protein
MSDVCFISFRVRLHANIYNLPQAFAAMTAQTKRVVWDGRQETCLVWKCHEGMASLLNKEPLLYWRYRPTSLAETSVWVWASRKYYTTPNLCWGKIEHITRFLCGSTRSAAMVAHCVLANELAEQSEMALHDKVLSRIAKHPPHCTAYMCTHLCLSCIYWLLPAPDPKASWDDFAGRQPDRRDPRFDF